MEVYFGNQYPETLLKGQNEDPRIYQAFPIEGHVCATKVKEMPIFNQFKLLPFGVSTATRLHYCD